MNTKKLLSIALALAMILAIAPLANVANAAGGMGQTVLEQNFDDTTKFDAAVGGEIDDTANFGGKWQSFATSTNPGSTIATGSVNVADADKVVYDNRVLALKYMNLNNNCPVLVSFPGGNMGQTTDFVVRFRIKRVDDASMFIGIGNGQFTADKQHAAVVIAADGAVTIGDSTTSIGTLAKNTWATVEMTSNKNGSATGSYTVTVTPDGASSFSGNGTTKGSAAAPEGYNSTNVNKLIIRTTSGTASGTVAAYMDDIYVERLKDNPVQVNQNFDNASDFETDAIYTADKTLANGEVWSFKTTGTPANGSCIANTTDGDYTTYLAYSGKQALKGFRSSSGKGAITIYPKETLGAGEDFALSFNYLRPAGEAPFTFTVGNSAAGTAVASIYVLPDGSLQVSSGSSWVDTGYDLPTNVWMNICMATDMANNKFSVTVSVDGNTVLDVDSGVPNESNALTLIYIHGALVQNTPGFVYGYFDDFSLEHVTSGGTEAYLAQDFENTTKFIVGNKADVATGDVGGRWKINADDTINTMVINTKDGDGLVTDFVASGTQSLKLVRVGNAYKGHIGAGFALMEGYDDYEVSMKVFHKAGNGFDILLGKGGYEAAASDSCISIAANGEISLTVDGVKTATGKYLMAGQWATLSLITDRAAGEYTVSVQYEGDATATDIGTGDLNNLDVNKLMFTVTTPVTADTAVAFIDDIVIDNYENPVPTYTITVNGDDDNEVTVPAQATYATQVSIVLDKEDGYDYNVTATVGGEAVTLHPVSTGYTIAGNDVKGNIVITVVKTAQAHVHSLTRVPATPASLTAAGNIEYWTCGCGKYFSDAAGTTEITQAQTVIPQLTPDDDDDDNTGSGSGSTTPPAPPVHTHTLTKVDGVAATVDAEGVKEHYTCTCGKKFADAAGTTEITDVSIPKLPAPTPDEDDVVPPTGDMGIAHLLVMAMTSVGAIVELKKKFHK